MLNLKSKGVRVSAGLLVGAVLLWASGIAPQAYNLIQTDSGSILPRASTLKFSDTASVTWACATSAGVTTCQATSSGSGSGDSGITVYSSGAAIAPAGTQFVAIGGGGQTSAAESDVRIGAPSAAVISNMFVNLDVALGTGNSMAIAWRKAGSTQTLTCTVTDPATTCSDTTHSFSVAQGDLIDIRLVTTGIVIVAPGLTIATQLGTSAATGYLTVQDEGSDLPQEHTLNFAGAGVTCADGSSKTTCTIPGGGSGSLSVSGFFLTDGSGNFYIGPQINLATLPVFGDFSWLTTQGGSTATSTGGGIVMTAPPSSGDVVRCFGQAVGANTILTVAFTAQSALQNFVSIGVGFFASGSGKLETFFVNNTTTSGGPGIQALGVTQWNSSTSFHNQVFVQGDHTDLGQFEWYRMEITGGNLIFSVSNDGVTFTPLYSESVSGGFFGSAPDNWCMAINANNNGGTTTPIETLYSWKMQ